MQTWIIDIMNQYGYLGIIFLIALENIFPPIPSEVILAFGGFLTASTALRAEGVITAATIGSLIGAIVLYGVGRLVQSDRIKIWSQGRLGRSLHFKTAQIEKAVLLFSRKGQSSVFFCRMVPVLRSLISIPAGIAKMPFLKFLTLTVIGSAIWNMILVLLGAAAGSSWPVIVEFFDTYSTLTITALIIITVLALAFKIYKRRRRQAER